jgi:hypothetical protein
LAKQKKLFHILSSQQFDRSWLEKSLFPEILKMQRVVRAGKVLTTLKGKSVCLLFYEPSTRTRTSFEQAVIKLGGIPVTTENAKEFSSAIKGETMFDTTRIINAYYFSAIVIRSDYEGASSEAASVSKVPVINAGDGAGQHPTQALLDLFTIYENFKKIDGQIYLESDLFYQGTRPAVNVGLSVSRVGGAAQTKAMKKVAGKLRLELAQFRELQTFVQFASDVDPATKERINKGRIITEILKQSDLNPMSFEKQVIVLYAALNGYFNTFEPAKIQEIEAKFLEYIDSLYKELVDSLREQRAITEDIEKKMKEAAQKFIEAQ